MASRRALIRLETELERVVHTRAPMGDVAVQVRDRLRSGALTDEEFDELLSERSREYSSQFWTCVDAARVACEWLSDFRVGRLVDVGSGVGKFCTLASLLLNRRVWGLERRGRLVFESRRLAQRLDAEVVFVEGDVCSYSSRGFDAFYAYNPFGEYLFNERNRLDEDSPSTIAEYVRSATAVEAWLRSAPQGALLVTYNGLGGRIPGSFVEARSRVVRGNTLRLWVKDRAERLESHFELEGEIVSPARLAELTNDGSADVALIRAVFGAAGTV